METFNSDGVDPYVSVKSINECGTSGCLAGYGPMAGIKARKGEDWEYYIDRVFDGLRNDKIWGTCFSAQ